MPLLPVRAAPRLAAALWLLLALFALRVAGQLLVAVGLGGWLPPWEEWFSGLIPYPWLLAIQILIIVVFAWICVDVSRGVGVFAVQRPAFGSLLIAFGRIYALAMALRYAIQMALYPEDRWLGGTIPIFFHLVLAGFILLLGAHHRRSAGGHARSAPEGAAPIRQSGADDRLQRWLPWVPYPLVMSLSFVLFAWLQARGVSLPVSTYVPILVAAALVTVFELAFPHRLQWRPPAGELKTDLVFMTVVQLALPPVVGFGFVYLLIEPARALDLPVALLWPHAWPVWTQAVLMVLVVDLLRYWLHRFAHENDTLWRLHAVHHSVEQLYWLNTARFHPLEKVLQMMLDSLPFLLMGVHPQVLAIYYIAYAANGFFQHCNIRLRYGVLNYIVGSAETHRWHHSRVPRESNANYGNTVIVWDLLFRTWFLPKDRDVRDLGLQESDYPKSFLTLMGAPFRR